MSMIGVKVPQERSVEAFVRVFRRAKTISSLELMYKRRTRDLHAEQLEKKWVTVFELEIYRAYLRVLDEIERGSVRRLDPIAKALVANDGLSDTRTNLKVDVRDGEVSLIHPKCVKLDNKKKARFSEAELEFARAMNELG
ncbi:hypothetical protein ACP3V3_16900 [Vibrio sp. PNB22_3_1]